MEESTNKKDEQLEQYTVNNYGTKFGAVFVYNRAKGSDEC